MGCQFLLFPLQTTFLRIYETGTPLSDITNYQISKFFLISAVGTLLQVVAGKLSVHFCSLVPDYLLQTVTGEGRSCWVTKHLDFLRLTQVSRDQCVVNITVAYQQ